MQRRPMERDGSGLWSIALPPPGPPSPPIHIRASYLLVSRRLGSFRATLRGDAFQAVDVHRHAVTGALFWYPRGNVRAGIEAIAGAGQKRAAVELRYSFGR